MTKHLIELLDYDFIDGTLNVMFSINNEEGYREIEICEEEFSDYIESTGNLEVFSDEWDYATESHYTKDWVISYDEYIEDYLEKNDLLEFIIDYFSDKDYPELIIE
jgi:hypothetical protein